MRFAIIIGLCLMVAEAVSVSAGSDADVLAGAKPMLTQPSMSDASLRRLFHRGVDHLRLGHSGQARQDLELVSALAEDDGLKVPASYQAGMAMRVAGDDRAALRSFHRALAGREDTAGIAPSYQAMARRYIDLAARPPAGEGLLLAAPKRTSAPDARPAPRTVWEAIDEAERWRVVGRVSKAREIYAWLVELHPGHPVVLNNYGILLADSAEYAEAERMLIRALQQRDSERYLDAIYDSLGWALYQQGRAEDALFYLRKSVEIRETPDRNRHLAAALESLGQTEAAKMQRVQASALEGELE